MTCRTERFGSISVGNADCADGRKGNKAPKERHRTTTIQILDRITRLSDECKPVILERFRWSRRATEIVVSNTCAANTEEADGLETHR